MSLNNKFFLTALLFLIFTLIFSSSNAQYFNQKIDVFSQTRYSFSEHERSLQKPLIYSFSLMSVNLAILVGAGLSDDKMKFENFKKAFTMPPAFDDDGWFYNYLSHPLMGSETYLRAREAGYGYFGCFLFSSAMSISWEFFLESWTERPSIQDLLITSTTGSLLGELRYWAKGKMNPKYHWFIDPINTLYLALCKPLSKDAALAAQRLSVKF